MIRVLLTLLVALFLASPAAASTYPGEHPAPAFVQKLAVKADAFWHARGVASCASNSPVLMAPSLRDDDDGDGDRELWGTGDGPAAGSEPGADGTSRDEDATGRATLGGCQVWLVSWIVRETASPRWYGMAIDLCTTIYHEAGHTAGLEHTTTGLMAPSGGGDPFECRVWGRRWENRKFKRERKR